MKVILSNGCEFPVRQINVRYSDNKNSEEWEDVKYPVIDVIADIDSINLTNLSAEPDAFDEFTLHYGDKVKKFTGFELYTPSIRENYTDQDSIIVFMIMSK